MPARVGRAATELHITPRELEHAIYTYIEYWNHEPKPFIWTKTADQILATLARFLKRLLTQDTGMPLVVFLKSQQQTVASD